MSRKDVLAALAAAAGLTLAAQAQATVLPGLAKTEALATLQQQVGAQSEDALSQMIQLAKSEGRGKSDSGNRGGKGGKSGKGGGGKGGKGPKSGHSDHGNHTGWDKGKGHHQHGNGHGYGHGNHHHPS